MGDAAVGPRSSADRGGPRDPQMGSRAEGPGGMSGPVHLVEAATRYGPMLAINSDGVITRSLLTYGEWGEHEISILARFTEAGCLTIDVGTNIGTHALALAKRQPAGLVWGFEPRPLVCDLAAVNCARNGAGNASVLPIACADVSGWTVLSPPGPEEANVGGFTLPAAKPAPQLSLLRFITNLRLSHPPDRVPQPPAVKVKVARLDDIDRPRQFRVSLIKVDTEGMELNVLSGARRLILADRPAIFFEVLDIPSAAPVVNLLRGAGYHMHWMETHQFNQNNFAGQRENIWYRAELGILATPTSQLPHGLSLPRVDVLPDRIPTFSDPRLGIPVPSFVPESP